MRPYWDRLGWRGRATYLAHLYKACTQQHHREMAPLFRTLLPPDGIVVDAGAHSGQFAKLFARLVPDGLVHAFEPSGYARSILHRAIRFNRLANVRIHDYGLSDEEADLELQTPIKRSGSAGFGIASFGRTVSGTATIGERVHVRRLDDAASDLGIDRIDLIKADIEGWELRLLFGARQCLERFRPALLVELSPDALRRAGDDIGAVEDYLRPLGYRPFLQEPGGDTWHPDIPTSAADVLWLSDRHADVIEDGALKPGRSGRPAGISMS